MWFLIDHGDWHTEGCPELGLGELRSLHQIEDHCLTGDALVSLPRQGGSSFVSVVADRRLHWWEEIQPDARAGPATRLVVRARTRSASPRAGSHPHQPQQRWAGTRTSARVRWQSPDIGVPRMAGGAHPHRVDLRGRWRRGRDRALLHVGLVGELGVLAGALCAPKNLLRSNSSNSP